MNNDPTKLSTLPPPPKGQQGVTFESLQHLPSPPAGQQGMTLDQIKNQSSQMTTTKSNLTLGQRNDATLNQSGEDVYNAITGQGSYSGQSSIRRGVEATASAFSTIPKLAYNFLPKFARDYIDKAGQGMSDGIANPKPGSLIGDLNNNPSYQKFATNLPENGFLKETLGTAQSLGDISGTILAAEGGVKTLQKGVNLTKSKINTAKSTVNTLSNRIIPKQSPDVKINEMISPKMTPKQAQIAQSEGRLYQGKEPTLFKAGTEDKVATSDKTFNATQTIKNTIPDAAKMKPSELYTAVDNKIAETAKNLRPQMESTPIKPETTQKLNDDWQNIKKSQMENAPATEEPNVLKRQKKFEELLKKSGSASHADLWDTRINYDNSVPNSVKKANSMSSESLQLQKDEWLQNRDILNKAINDNTFGMGETSQKAFRDMSNLYEAKTNLTSKAKVNEAQISKVNQFLKNNPKTAKVLGGYTVYEIAKHLGIPLP